LAEGKSSIMSKKNAFSPLEGPRFAGTQIKNSNGAGFTLVELLVVIAIIALLMSILMPALGRVRRQAKMVICQSNLKQWTICFSMYTDDFDGSFPRGWCGNGYSFSTPQEYANSYWMQALRPYYGDQGDLRLCAMATKPGTQSGGGPFGGALIDSTFAAWGIAGAGQLNLRGEPFGTWPYLVIGDYGSYGWNGWVGDPPYNVPAGLGQNHPVKWNWRKANVSGTGNIPLIMANQWVDGWPLHQDTPPLFMGQPWGTSGNENMPRFCQNRHDGSLNSAFLDWSVRRVGLKQLWRLKWHRRFDLNGPWTITGNAKPSDWPDWMRNFKDY
jgi:prepilin-type N-terminal cleavage/methylation domain-containing protein/prepilin-type processing-associated H-X9-DG protein